MPNKADAVEWVNGGADVRPQAPIRMKKRGHPDDFMTTMQRSVAVTAIGPSALRNQGASGIVDAARDYLSSLNLKKFKLRKEEAFLSLLNSETNLLMGSFPEKAQTWGAARKAMNLFLRDVLYNKYLCDEFNISAIERWLEIPLDSMVAKGLRKRGKKGKLPAWPGLKRLTPEISRKYQTFAKNQAEAQGLSRIHLDIYLWLRER